MNRQNNFAILILFFFSSVNLAHAAKANCIAHRGYSSKYLENSLEAIREAILVESDGVEFDIRFTKDAVPVLMHDQTLGKTAVARTPESRCPLDLGVAYMSFDELRENCMLKNGEDIPSVSEVLDAMAGYDGYIFFDLKEHPTKKFFDVLIDKNIRDIDTIRFMAFEKKYLKEVKFKRPQANTLLLSHLFPRGLFHTGLNVNQRSRNLLFPFRWIGKETGVWTTNSVREITRALKRKITFITTDYPERCLELRSH